MSNRRRSNEDGLSNCGRSAMCELANSTGLSCEADALHTTLGKRVEEIGAPCGRRLGFLELLLEVRRYRDTSRTLNAS